MSFDEAAGQVIAGEFNADSLLKLFSYEPPRYKIPVKCKCTGNRKLKKARKHGR